MALVQPMNLATLSTDNENEAKNVIPERSPNSTEVILPRFLAIKKSNADLPTQFDQKKAKILVLGFDKVILHLTETQPKKGSYLEITKKGKKSYVVLRPFLSKFLSEAAADYNICIYTSNKRKLAIEILKEAGILEYFFEIYDRTHCQRLSRGVYMKSLMSLELPLKRTLFVDSSSAHIRSHPMNGLEFPRFEGNPKDDELCDLEEFADYLNQFDDIRPIPTRLGEFFEKKKRELIASPEDRNSTSLEGPNIKSECFEVKSKSMNIETKTSKF